MVRHPVDSSNLRSIGYDAESKTLEIEFGSPSAPPHKCSIHQFCDVSASEYAALMKAESHGKHFAKHLKPKLKGKKLEQ